MFSRGIFILVMSFLVLSFISILGFFDFDRRSICSKYGKKEGVVVYWDNEEGVCYQLKDGIKVKVDFKNGSMSSNFIFSGRF